MTQCKTPPHKKKVPCNNLKPLSMSKMSNDMATSNEPTIFLVLFNKITHLATEADRRRNRGWQHRWVDWKSFRRKQDIVPQRRHMQGAGEVLYEKVVFVKRINSKWKLPSQYLAVVFSKFVGLTNLLNTTARYCEDNFHFTVFQNDSNLVV